MSLSVSHLWLIPTLPLLAAGVSALLPRSGFRFAAAAAIGAMSASFVLACLALAGALAEPAAHQGRPRTCTGSFMKCSSELRRRSASQRRSAEAQQAPGAAARNAAA